jgi:acyl carrier protein
VIHLNAFTELQNIVADTLGVPAASVRLESKAADFASWDSVHHLLLVMEIEERFKFKFPLEEIAEIDSVEKIVEAIEKRVTT